MLGIYIHIMERGIKGVRLINTLNEFEVIYQGKFEKLGAGQRVITVI